MPPVSVPSTPQKPQVQVPKLNTDPVWSLQPWPVEVDLGVTVVAIPALPAADWLALLMTAELDTDAVFPGLLEDGDSERVEDLLYSGQLSLEHFNHAFLDVVTAVGARPWWVTLRLIDIARREWAFLGANMLLEVDAQQLSLSAWLDVLTLTIMRLIEPDTATMFTLQLEAPPPEMAHQQEELEMTPAEFMSLA